MTIYNQLVIRDSNTIILGQSERKTKKAMFNAILENREEVLKMFDDCGEFEFIWNSSAKAFEFISESGDKVGFAVNRTNRQMI